MITDGRPDRQTDGQPITISPCILTRGDNNKKQNIFLKIILHFPLSILVFFLIYFGSKHILTLIYITAGLMCEKFISILQEKVTGEKIPIQGL